MKQLVYYHVDFMLLEGKERKKALQYLAFLLKRCASRRAEEF